MSTFYNIIAVFLGSGIGGVCRWGLGSVLNSKYPLGTIAVNITGCLLIGILSKHLPGDSMQKMLLVTGFCGGFTTFSTFMNENFLMLRGEELPLSLVYMAASLILGLLACWIGWRI